MLLETLRDAPAHGPRAPEPHRPPRPHRRACRPGLARSARRRARLALPQGSLRPPVAAAPAPGCAPGGAGGRRQPGRATGLPHGHRADPGGRAPHRIRDDHRRARTARRAPRPARAVRRRRRLRGVGSLRCVLRGGHRPLRGDGGDRLSPRRRPPARLGLGTQPGARASRPAGRRPCARAAATADRRAGPLGNPVPDGPVPASAEDLARAPAPVRGERGPARPGRGCAHPRPGRDHDHRSGAAPARVRVPEPGPPETRVGPGLAAAPGAAVTSCCTATQTVP